MTMNKAVQAAYKVATRLNPDVKTSYKTIRAAEGAVSAIDLPDPRCRVEDIEATAPDGYQIACRVFTPRDIDFSLREGLTVSDDFRGTILFFHGGGWVNGDVDFYTDVCTTMAVKLERRVVSVEYRRAPEHRFPQAPEDCYEVARQLFAGELLPDVCPERIVLFGDSAGGNLAAAVSLMAHDRGVFSPTTQVLLYPATYGDHDPATTPFDSVRENGDGYVLTAQDVQDYMGLYAASPADWTNPYLAPLLAPDLEGQPRTLVVTAQYCPLRDEGEAYAARLREAGADVELFRVLDAVHGYFMYPSVARPVRATYQILEHFLDGAELVQEGGPAWLEIPGIA